MASGNGSSVSAGGRCVSGSNGKCGIARGGSGVSGIGEKQDAKLGGSGMATYSVSGAGASAAAAGSLGANQQ